MERVPLKELISLLEKELIRMYYKEKSRYAFITAHAGYDFAGTTHILAGDSGYFRSSRPGFHSGLPEKQFGIVT